MDRALEKDTVTLAQVLIGAATVEEFVEGLAVEQQKVIQMAYRAGWYAASKNIGAEATVTEIIKQVIKNEFE